jgi:hypothetical protein
MLGSIAALAAPRSTARRPVRGASGSSAADEASAHTANIRSTVHRFVDDLEANSRLVSWCLSADSAQKPCSHAHNYDGPWPAHAALPVPRAQEWTHAWIELAGLRSGRYPHSRRAREGDPKT